MSMEQRTFGDRISLVIRMITRRYYPCAITEGPLEMPLIRGQQYPPAPDSGKSTHSDEIIFNMQLVLVL